MYMVLSFLTVVLEIKTTAFFQIYVHINEWTIKLVKANIYKTSMGPPRVWFSTINTHYLFEVLHTP